MLTFFAIFQYCPRLSPRALYDSVFQLHWIPSAPRSVTLCFFPFLPVWLSLYDLVPSCGKFHVDKRWKVFYLMIRNTILKHIFCFCLGLKDLFDQPLSLLWPSPLPPLRITLGIESLKPVRCFPISSLQRSSAWSWCRWSCPGVIWFWNHWRVPEPRGNTQMKNSLELKLLTKVFHVVARATNYVVLNLWALITHLDDY